MPFNNIPLTSSKYEELAGELEIPDFRSEHNQENEYPRYFVGQQINFKGFQLIVEAFYIGHRAYAIRNKKGKQIKWITRTELLEKLG